MAWSHANWRSKPSRQERFDTLGLHMEEVSQQIGASIKADGLEANRMPLKLYYDSLQKDFDKLERQGMSKSRRARVSYRTG